MKEDCIFCQITNNKTETDFLYEDEKVVAFNDINPQAETHVLVVPKKHIPTVKDLQEEDRGLVSKMIWTAKKIAADKKLDGYRLQINVGRSGGQEIDHIHLHLLANK